MPNRAIQEILELEQRLGLWNERVFGFPAWGLERLRRYRTLKDGQTSTVRQTRLKGLQQDLSDFRRSARDLLALAGKLRNQRDVWVLSSTLYRRKGSDGDHPCIFAGDLERQLGERVLYLETNTSHLTIPRADNVVRTDAAYWAIRSSARLGHRLLGDSLLANPSPLLDALPASRRGVVLVESLASNALYRLALQLLRAGRPRALFVLCGYHGHLPTQLAARRLGIPVIELQHGIIHESHPGYILPQLPQELERQLYFPDHLVVFGRYFGELLVRHSPRWAGRWSVGGHPVLRQALLQHGHSPPPQLSGPPRVVFFSQFEAPIQQQIDRVAAEFAQQSAGRYRISIKPHPREAHAETTYRAALSAGVELLGSTDNSYELLRSTSAAITVSSTLAIEALAYPCRSVALTSSNWTEGMETLIADGYLETAEDGSGLLRLLDTPPRDRDRASVARHLFGIGEPQLDFAALIERQAGAQ
jgi:hypothetical protein